MWTVKTELINPDTELRKIYATYIDGENSQMFFVKARMKTPEEKKAVWDNIWQQYLKATKPVVDALVTEGKNNLEGRVP